MSDHIELDGHRPAGERDQFIDRLVAGDLDEDRRRDLLAWLDDEPVRWRGCALAFLEVQMWEQAFGNVVSGGPTELHTHPGSQIHRKGRRRVPRSAREFAA